MMKPLNNAARPLVTELLLLPDGAVLADRLTPAMAALLEQIPLHPDAQTQLSLRAEVRLDTPTVGTPGSRTQRAP